MAYLVRSFPLTVTASSTLSALLAMLNAADYNIPWLLQVIIKKGLGLLLCLFPVKGLAGMLEKLAEFFGCNRAKTRISGGFWLEINFAVATNLICF
jgi:hypothetical protein